MEIQPQMPAVPHQSDLNASVPTQTRVAFTPHVQASAVRAPSYVAQPVASSLRARIGHATKQVMHSLGTMANAFRSRRVPSHPISAEAINMNTTVQVNASAPEGPDNLAGGSANMAPITQPAPQVDLSLSEASTSAHMSNTGTPVCTKCGSPTYIADICATPCDIAQPVYEAQADARNDCTCIPHVQANTGAVAVVDTQYDTAMIIDTRIDCDVCCDTQAITVTSRLQVVCLMSLTAFNGLKCCLKLHFNARQCRVLIDTGAAQSHADLQWIEEHGFLQQICDPYSVLTANNNKFT